MAAFNPCGIITLTTDFGTSGSYVGAMRGAALRRFPAARLVDITHEIGPQDVTEAARILAAACPHFPPGTVHLVVVDPGVGTTRAPVVVQAGEHAFVGPDNGVLAPVAARLGDVCAWRIEHRRLMADRVSDTFHGRDIFAPTAGELAAGFALDQVGPPLALVAGPATPEPFREAGALHGQVQAVDHFGNLLTNIPFSSLPRLARVRVGGAVLERQVASYGHAAPGALVFLASSEGMLEIAVNGGSAAQRLGVSRSAPVRVESP